MVGQKRLFNNFVGRISGATAGESLVTRFSAKLWGTPGLSHRRCDLRKYAYLTMFSLMLIWRLPGMALAHGGGVPRLQDVTAGAYRISAWTQPEPWVKDEESHLSLILTLEQKDAQGNRLDQPVTDATVYVLLRSATSRAEPIQLPAVLGTDLGGIFYEAIVQLPAAGQWQVQIAMTSAAGAGEAEFVIDVQAERVINWWLVGGSSIAILVLLGLAVALMRR